MRIDKIKKTHMDETTSKNIKNNNDKIITTERHVKEIK